MSASLQGLDFHLRNLVVHGSLQRLRTWWVNNKEMYLGIQFKSNQVQSNESRLSMN